jgi:hypothetical protein
MKFLYCCPLKNCNSQRRKIKSNDCQKKEQMNISSKELTTEPLPMCHRNSRDLAAAKRRRVARQPVAATLLGPGGGISRPAHRTGGGARALAGGSGELEARPTALGARAGGAQGPDTAAHWWQGRRLWPSRAAALGDWGGGAQGPGTAARRSNLGRRRRGNWAAAHRGNQAAALGERRRAGGRSSFHRRARPAVRNDGLTGVVVRVNGDEVVGAFLFLFSPRSLFRLFNTGSGCIEYYSIISCRIVPPYIYIYI